MKRIDRRKVRKLIALSLTEGRLDPKKIALVSQMLTKRAELLYYYQLLLAVREKEKVVVTTAIAVPTFIAKRFTGLFAGRDVLFRKDPSILAGLAIQFSDFVFDASLKHYFAQIRKQHEIN